MSLKKNSTVGLQIEAPSPTPEKFNYDGELGNLPKPLNIDEKKFLLAVERGDCANVRRMLQKALRSSTINLNCVDSFGRGALTLAIDGENLEMVELLIIMGVETKDALLEAINQEFVEAVELLLEHEELIHKEGEPYSWQKVDISTAQYSPEITPLILAAHRNNYEIIKLLLDRGATLPQPHDVKCPCDECIKNSTEDSLRHSLSRVGEYRALASPSLIALSSNDPLQTAFQLSWELRNLAFAEQECKTEYLELRKQCQKFAVDLLDQTRSSQELAIILNYDPESPPYVDGDHMKLKRLEMAIDYKQKKFVAHPNIQQLLASLWYEGVPGFRRKTAAAKLFIISKVAILFPFYCLMYMLMPYCGTAKIIRKPFMKFLIHASSYLFFLFILILVSQRAEVQMILLLGTSEMKATLNESLKRQRGNAPTPLELLVVVYVAGFIWQETLEIFGEGIQSYLRNMWNFIDFSRNSLYCFVFLLRAVAYFQQTNEINQDPKTAFVPREQWDDFDPQLIAEGLFAAANIFSALKLVHLFSINPHLGPLQISLGRMVIDIVKFFFIYSLVLFAFACGLNQLLWYYADLEKAKCYSLPSGLPDWNNEGDACMKWRRFGNLFESSQSLFWASFGMVGLENFELLGIKTYTRFWGLLMFGSYSVINVIVLLNLLIAMMSNSYAMIEQHSDTEWKFARTKLWMSYFEESATLPPPFNIFPTVKNFVKLCRQKSKRDFKRESTIRRKEERDRANRYTNVMRSLVWRYVSTMHRKFEESPVTEDDINEVKGEISTMRYEMLEVFERNGMDVSSADRKEKTVLAKRMKIWERRLMKDFHVAPVEQPDEVEEVGEPNPNKNESPLERFRRVSKLVASQSANIKWNEVIRCATIEAHSQIGRCRNRESFKNQQTLMKAMEQARRLIEQSSRTSSPTNSTYSYNIEQTNQTLVQLLKNISEEINEISPQNTLRVKSSGNRSVTPLSALNAQLQTLISKSPSPFPTRVKPKSQESQPMRETLDVRSVSSTDGVLSPPPQRPQTPSLSVSSSEKPKSPISVTKTILKSRSPTPDSVRSLDEIPIIAVEEVTEKIAMLIKPESPKLINLNDFSIDEGNEEKYALKQGSGDQVKVIKRKAPKPEVNQDIAVSRPAVARVRSSQGMIPPPPAKDEFKPMQIPILSTTPATPLFLQKTLCFTSDATSDSNSIVSEVVKVEIKETEKEKEEIISTSAELKSEPPTEVKVESKDEETSAEAKIDPPTPAMIATSSSQITCKSTELLIPNVKQPPSSPACLRPGKKVEDVKTIKRQPKAGWL